MVPIYIIPLAVFISVVILCLVIYYFVIKRKEEKEQELRIEKAVNIDSARSQAEANQEAAIESLRRDTRISSIKWLDTFLSKILKEKSKSLMILIEQSGLRIKVSEFLMLTLLTGFIGMIILDMIFHIPFIGLGSVGIPFIFLHIFKAKRVDDFVKQLPSALDLLSGDLRAGIDIQSGLKHLSDEFPAPLGEEFAKVVVEINLGLTISDALNNLSRRLNTMDVQMLCTGIVINRELGGNLSELMQNIADTVRERFRLKGMIKALTAENEMSAMLLIALPIGLFFLLTLISPDIYGKFMYDPIGKIILGICVVSMTIGYIFMKKLTKVEV